MHKRKIGRDARTGRFISVCEAKQRPRTTTVETMTGFVRPVSRRRRRSARHLTEENQNQRPFKAGKDI